MFFMVPESRSNQSDRVSDRSDAVHLGISLLYRYHMHAVYAGRSFIISSCREDGIEKEENSVFDFIRFSYFYWRADTYDGSFPAHSNLYFSVYKISGEILPEKIQFYRNRIVLRNDINEQYIEHIWRKRQKI